MADAPDLGSGEVTREGSTPFSRTIPQRRKTLMTTITSYTEVSPTRRSLTLEIPAEMVQHETEHAVRDLARNLRLPGFRPGKVPADLVRRRYSADIRGHVLEHLLENAMVFAIKEKGLDPIGEPKIEDIKLEDGQPFTFRLEVEIRQNFTPKDYRGLKVPYESTEVTSEDVKKALEEMRQSHATYEPVEDRPAMDGDFALVDIEGTFPHGDGKDFKHEKVLIEIGGEQTMPEFSAHLRNAEPGMSTTFQKAFDENQKDSEFAGKVVLYTISLSAIKQKVLPELDDEFARQALSSRETGEPADGATLAKLEETLFRVIGREKERAYRSKKERAVLDGLLALNNEVHAPESMVEAQLSGMIKDYARSLAQQGMDLKEAGIPWERIREETRPLAERKVKEYLLLDAIAKEENITVENSEFDALIRSQARAVGSTPDELKAGLQKSGRIDSMREELKMQKVLELLLAEAVTPSEP